MLLSILNFPCLPSTQMLYISPTNATLSTTFDEINQCINIFPMPSLRYHIILSYQYVNIVENITAVTPIFLRFHECLKTLRIPFLQCLLQLLVKSE